MPPGPKRGPKWVQNNVFLTNFVPGPQCLSLGPKTKKMRAEKPCKTPPPEFQMVPYGASYGQKPFWASQAPFWGHFSEQMVPKCRKGHQKSASRNSPGCSRLFPVIPVVPGKMVSGTARQTYTSTRAGGQDDGSYTNSLKQIKETSTLALSILLWSLDMASPFPLP